MADGISNLPAIRQTSHALVTFDEMERMAAAFAASGLFGAKTKEAALSLLMIAQAEGIHPALAVMEYDIIEGKPARKAERLLARFQLSGGKVEWLAYEDTKVAARFDHPQGSAVTIEWTIERARAVMIYTKEGMKPLANKAVWRSYPRAMLRSRVISEGVRACFPGAALVTLTSEEAGDGEVMQAHIVDEDFSQDAAPDNGADFLRGKAKDDLVEMLGAKMAAAKSDGEMAVIWAECETYRGRVSKLVFSGLETARDQHEQRIEAANYQDHLAETDITLAIVSEKPSGSPFEALKEAGLACETKSELKAWAATLTPEALKQCSGDEYRELRNIYANKLEAAEAQSHGA